MIYMTNYIWKLVIQRFQSALGDTHSDYYNDNNINNDKINDFQLKKSQKYNAIIFQQRNDLFILRNMTNVNLMDLNLEIKIG